MKKIIVIAGPTASGKTKLAIELAKKFKTEIINVDSRQCYQELNIGVAKPSQEECAEVRHHFVNSHSIHHPVNAAEFSDYVAPIIDFLFQQKDIVIMAGGTGLYFNAYLYGLDDIPNIPSEIQSEIESNYEKHGIDWLIESLQNHDPKYLAQASHGEERNTHRLMRALGVFLTTGKSILDYRKGMSKKVQYEIDFNVVEIDPIRLSSNISLRIDGMIDAGLVDEVKSLYQYKKLKPLQTIGYQEFFEYLDGMITFNEAKERLQHNTMMYAKRQKTWMKKYSDADHLSIEEIKRKYEVD